MIELAIIAFSFATIILLVAMRKDINIALLTGSIILLAYFAGMNFYRVIAETLTDSRTIFLLATSLTISLLAELYRRSGGITELSRSLASKIRSPRGILILIPSVLGLLPIAGGALMSAPIVGAIGENLGMSNELMIFLNVWFRHFLFLFYPMGQTLIVASATMGISPIALAVLQIPIALFMAIYGLIFTRGYKGDYKSSNASSVSLWRSGTPMLSAIVASLALNQLIGNFGIPIGISIGILLLIYLLKQGKRDLIASLKSKMVVSLTISSFSIMLLQHSIMSTDASKAISSTINNSSIPTIVLETVFPGILSALTSSPITGIITMAPILSSMHPLSIYEASLIYTSSYISYTVSPTHLCLIYTANYFNRGVTSSYKYMLPAALSVIFFTIIYYFILLPHVF
ncbi:MAG: DUF401 family protein [Fervidicoccaceae archaeon]